jgi:(4-O-methyl)-D-glucuronate---lignin esterase
MNQKCKSLLGPVMVVAILTLAGTASSQSQGDSLEPGFENPPDSAKPRVWWHWTGGNVTEDGITKDLEWMKRIGIGGAQMADIGMGGGQTITNPIVFFTPRWFDTVKYAAAESKRLGLEMSIFSCSGWSETGGSWVKPEQAMKKLVWSETNVEGPITFDGKLPQPPTNNGTFGGLRGLNTGGGRGASQGTYYGDSAVIAFRTPPDETTMPDLNPKVTSSGGSPREIGISGAAEPGRGVISRGEIDGAPLWDDNLSTGATITAGTNGVAWVQYEFAQPITVRAVTVIAQGRGVPFGQIQVSDDGKDFRTVAEMPGAVQYRAGNLKTYAFPATTARFVRVEMTGAGPGPDEVIYQTEPQPARSYRLNEFIVHTGARVDRWEEKAGFNFFYNYHVAPTPPVPQASEIQPDNEVVLTSKMDKDGTLTWDVPPGKWTIMRMGYSLTGARNRAGTAAGAGLEVDKLNRKDVESYFHGYFDPIQKALGPLFGTSLRYVTMDSWEAGMQNWTDDMISEFKKRRGYDPTPFLPVLAGRVVGSSDISDRFLWDFRRTLADMLAENHYGTMAELLRQKGIGIYAEAEGVSMEMMEDTLLDKSEVEIPMGEFWLGRMHPPPEYYVDVRMASSSAHIYGKQFVGTESFTGGGYDSPATYKNLADYWFAQGVNRIMFHSSAQQPLDTKPGNTMVGTHFNRNITWAEEAKPFVSYLSRIQFMLSQGRYVADFAYLLDEGVPSSQPFWGAGLQPAPPEGYDYDTINADVLLNHATVSTDGRLVLSDGMSYRILVLPQSDSMRPELLRKIRDLVAGGLTVVGPKPTHSPSLEGYPNADAEVQAVADEIWGDLDGKQRNRRFYGKGLVVWGLPLEQVVAEPDPQLINPITDELPQQFAAASLDLPKDAEFAGPLDASIVWIHRRTRDADYYFVANRRDAAQDIEARFRVAGKEAELWHPDTGEVEPASYAIENNRTTVPLHLEPRESVFVVFQHPTTNLSRTLPPVRCKTIATVTGAWDVSFPPHWGAPDKIQLDRLESWTANSDAGVKYFSGTATYTKTVQAQSSWFAPGARLWLDLGAVGDIAEVIVNGKSLGELWKPPYRIDVTDALKPGANQLEIKVTNEWNNRIAGDRLVAPDKRVLSSGGGRGFGFGFGRRGGGLAPSGLLGPVTVVAMTTASNQN